MIYKLQNGLFSDTAVAVTIIGQAISIPFNPENSDYQTFKTAINDEIAQLETADGVLMSAEEAKAYVATLP